MSRDTSPPPCGLIFIFAALLSPTLHHFRWFLRSCIAPFPPARVFIASFPLLSSSPRQSLEDLEEAKRKKKKEKMGLGSLSRVFARGKQRKSLDPGLFDGTSTPDYYIEEDADW